MSPYLDENNLNAEYSYQSVDKNKFSACHMCLLYCMLKRDKYLHFTLAQSWECGESYYGEILQVNDFF